MRADPLPPTFGRRPLPLRGRGDTAAAAAEEWESLCRVANPAHNLRTKIWVTMRLRGRGDTAAAVAEEWESLCRVAIPAHNLRTKIW